MLGRKARGPMTTTATRNDRDFKTALGSAKAAFPARIRRSGDGLLLLIGP